MLGRLHPDDAGERLRPDPERADDDGRRVRRQPRATWTLVAVVAAGVAGNVVGSWIAWAAGYYGRIELLEKNKLVHINPKHLARADRWFERYGDAAVFWARMLPIVRTFISLPAGVARMPFWRFTVLTLLGCIPWMLGLTLLGKSVGENWRRLQDKMHYFDYLIAALIVIGGVYLFVRWRRDRRRAAAASRRRPTSAA